MSQNYDKELVVGDIVYQAYAALSLGKVQAVRPTQGRTASNGRYDQHAQVLWRKTGTTQWVPAWHLQSLADLIVDHEKKLAGHKQRFKEMQEWSGVSDGFQQQLDTLVTGRKRK